MSSFEVSLVFLPKKLSCSGQFSRRTMLVSGWTYGVFSVGPPSKDK